MRERVGVWGNGLERKIQSCQETVTDAAVGDAEERTAGQRAGVSRPALHLNAELSLAEEEGQNWWMNMEKLSPSLGSPPSETLRAFRGVPRDTAAVLLLQQTDGLPSDGRLHRHFQPHAAKRARFFLLRKSADFLTGASHGEYSALKCAPTSGGSSLAFRGNGWWGQGTHRWQTDTSEWRTLTHYELCRLQLWQGTETPFMDKCTQGRSCNARPEHGPRPLS